MKILVLCLLVVSQFAMAKVTELECEVVQNNRRVNLTTIEIQNLTDCDFIKSGTICEYQEGKDMFSALAFEPQSVRNANVGDQIFGYYLNGYVWKTWEVTSDELMICSVK